MTDQEYQHPITSFGGYKYPQPPLVGIEPGAVLYSAGIGTDATHDLAFGLNFDMNIVMIDPSPHSISYVGQVMHVINNGTLPEEKIIGKEALMIELASRVKNGETRNSNFSFLPVGLYTENGEATFYRPKNASDVASYSMYSTFRGSHHEYVDFQASVLSLSQIMKIQGHSKIDILKIDVEGVEYDIIDNMINEEIFPKYVVVDFDLARSTLTDWMLMHEPLDYQDALSIHLKCIKKMLMFYRVFHSLEYDITFVRKDIVNRMWTNSGGTLPDGAVEYQGEEETGD